MDKTDWLNVTLALTPAGLSRNKRIDADIWYSSLRLPALKGVQASTEQVMAYREQWPNCKPIVTFTLDEADLELGDPQGWVDSGLVVVVSNEPEPEPELEPNATEAAMRLAAERGLDLDAIEGTGRDGRVTFADVEAVNG